MVCHVLHPLLTPIADISIVLTALNLSTLAASGPLSPDHVPANRSFVVSQLAPFATNVQFQRMSPSSLFLRPHC
jgi:hypothetical protein